MLNVSSEEITGGSIPRALVLLAAPLVVQNLVHVLNNFIDTLWLGRVGEDAVAAVGANFPVMALLFGLLVVTTIGTQIVLSQRVGADDEPGARRAGFNGTLLTVGIAAVVAAFVGLNAGAVMRLLTGGAGFSSLAAVYLGTWIVFFPVAVASDTVENSFVGWGDSGVAFRIVVVTVGINILLDPFLILGWGPFPALGVRGAALATGTGYVCGLAVALGYALDVGSAGEFRLTRRAARLDADLSREILRVGTPLSGKQAAAQSVRVAVVALVAITGGQAGLAAYTVGARVASVAFSPGLGFQRAAQSMIGQNVGADRPDRAYRTTAVGVAIAGGGLGVVGAVQFLLPELITNVVVPDITDRGFELTVEYLLILAYGYWALGVTYVLLAAFNGASRTRVSLATDLGKYWGIRLPVALLALPAGTGITVAGVTFAPGIDLGVVAIFWSVTVSNVVGALALGAYFFYETRPEEGMFVRAAERLNDAAD